MAQAILTLTDDADGKATMALDFGTAFEPESQAHQMIAILAESVLTNANSFQKIEDTADGVDVEPGVIVTAN